MTKLSPSLSLSLSLFLFLSLSRRVEGKEDDEGGTSSFEGGAGSRGEVEIGDRGAREVGERKDRVGGKSGERNLGKVFNSSFLISRMLALGFEWQFRVGMVRVG